MKFFTFYFYEIVVWVATIICCLVALACRRVPLKRPGGIGQPLPNPIAVILPIILFTAFAALRKNVGDTFYYALSFELLPDSNEVSFELFCTSMFSFCQNIIRNMTDDSQWLVAFSAIVAMPVPLIILYRYSYPFDLSIYLFVTYGYLGGMMNGMRQYMAAAIFLCGTRYLFSLKRGSFFKYAVFVILAYFMHSSAIIMLVIYFVVRRKAWKFMSYVMLAGSVVGVIAFDAILPSFLSALETTDYSVYSTNGWFVSGEESGTTIFRSVFAAIPIVLAYFNRDRMRLLGHVGDILINMAFVNTAIYVISLYNWIFARVAIYMSVYYIILLSWVVTNGIKQKDRSAYTFITYVLFFIYSRFLGYQIAGYESDYIFPGQKLF